MDVFRAHIDAEGGQASGSTAFALAAVFGGVQDVRAYQAARGAVEQFA
ncbi:hypothetical protein QNO09_29835 [Streptomyces sp. 378]|nr:hypothetical protein [Streptomyces sp. 378]MDK1347427.1 hypothetical protein [Streptomyces sp. 378]